MNDEKLIAGLTNEQLGAAFRYIQHQYHLEDAETVLQDYLEVEEIDISNIFGDSRQVSFKDLTNESSRYYALERMVQYFEKNCDNNVADFDTWQGAAKYILEVLAEEQ